MHWPCLNLRPVSTHLAGFLANVPSDAAAENGSVFWNEKCAIMWETTLHQQKLRMVSGRYMTLNIKNWDWQAMMSRWKQFVDGLKPAVWMLKGTFCIWRATQAENHHPLFGLWLVFEILLNLTPKDLKNNDKILDSLCNASFWTTMQKVKSSYMISRRRLCCWVLSVCFALWTPPVRCHSCFQTQTQETPGRINIWPCIYKKRRLPGKQNRRLHKDSPEIQTELNWAQVAGSQVKRTRRNK